ncbi:MAG TPA: 16S rRNA (cytidine(1402)-2'-O)-methyltransferase [Mycobacteriales bacterium]|nr:16S rRNA (cytidine(1402)-2'-O)-methyltransferase [Mycobacteriales bacterium]
MQSTLRNNPRVPLILAGVPIGRPDDASDRLKAALGTADVVAAEDTRRLARLCKDLGVTVVGRVVSYFEANEAERTPRLLESLRAGDTVLLVTDAGMPSVSDPGFRLVAAAAEEDLPVTCLPGPSAVTTALAVSGLASDRFCFEGFVPRKGGERRARLGELVAERRTVVLFEAPHRLAACLADMVAVLGPGRRAVVCRELTKTHEEVARGTLAELAERFSGEVRGEVTVVVEGSAERAVESTPDELARLVAVREESGEPRKEAIAGVARELGVPRRDVYDAVVAAKPPRPTG